MSDYWQAPEGWNVRRRGGDIIVTTPEWITIKLGILAKSVELAILYDLLDAMLPPPEEE